MKITPGGAAYGLAPMRPMLATLVLLAASAACGTQPAHDDGPAPSTSASQPSPASASAEPAPSDSDSAESTEPVSGVAKLGNVYTWPSGVSIVMAKPKVTKITPAMGACDEGVKAYQSYKLTVTNKSAQIIDVSLVGVLAFKGEKTLTPCALHTDSVITGKLLPGKSRAEWYDFPAKPDQIQVSGGDWASDPVVIVP